MESLAAASKEVGGRGMEEEGWVVAKRATNALPFTLQNGLSSANLLQT